MKNESEEIDNTFYTFSFSLKTRTLFLIPHFDSLFFDYKLKRHDCILFDAGNYFIERLVFHSNALKQ